MFFMVHWEGCEQESGLTPLMFYDYFGRCVENGLEEIKGNLNQPRDDVSLN